MANKKKRNNLMLLLVVGVIVLIVVLAIMTGVKEGKKAANTTTNEYKPESSQNNVVNTNKPQSTASATPTVTPTATPVETAKPVDTTNMSGEEKENYAKTIAKNRWEKVGANIAVTYEYETVLDDGRYMIRIVNNATTIDWCYVDIKTGTAELETYQ